MACKHKSKVWDNGWCNVACRYCTLTQESTCEHNHKTNADRIRSMSDEELAVFWSNHYDDFCQNKPECGALLDTDGCIPEEMCVAYTLEWLRQPAEEGTP